MSFEQIEILQSYELQILSRSLDKFFKNMRESAISLAQRACAAVSSSSAEGGSQGARREGRRERERHRQLSNQTTGLQGLSV